MAERYPPQLPYSTGPASAERTGPRLATAGWAWLLPVLDEPVRGLEATGWEPATWLPVLPAILVAFVLARRFPLDRQRHYALLHLVGTGIVALLAASLDERIRAYLPSASGSADGLLDPRTVAYYATTYLAVLAGAHALAFYRRSRAQEARATLLSNRIAEARLDVLRGQLHPHFLFNALNAIAMTVRHRSPDEAVESISSLCELFRYMLAHAAVHEVPLEQELDFTRRYLSLEQSLRNRALEYELNATPEAARAYVPFLMLQPVVENAVRHGQPKDGRPGHLTLSARREGDTLRITLSDNGPGLPGGWSLANITGVGLANTHARLEKLYGSLYTLAFSSPRRGGLNVDLTIPYRIEPVLSPPSNQ